MILSKDISDYQLPIIIIIIIFFSLYIVFVVPLKNIIWKIVIFVINSLCLPVCNRLILQHLLLQISKFVAA